MEGSVPGPRAIQLMALLGEVLRQRDAYTATHCERVGLLAVALAQRLGIEGERLSALGLAARLHDIGKIGIPDAVLLKPGRHDPAERAIMQTHSERGEKIVLACADFPWQQEVAAAIRHHHEHHDGGGYPDGLAGAAIPLMSRVLAVADSYEAMSRPRVYQLARRHAEVMEVLLHERGGKHEPRIVDTLAAQKPAWFRQFDGMAQAG